MSEENQGLVKRDLYASDPFCSLLIDGCHFSPFRFALFTAVFGSIIAVLIALLTGTLYFENNERVGLFNDWLPWVMLLITGPCISWIYLWSFDTIQEILQGFQSSHITTINELDERELVLKYYGKKWQKYVAVAIAILSIIIISWNLPGLEGYWAQSKLPSLIHIGTILATFIVVYMVVIFILNLGNNLLILNYIFSRKNININLDLFHPDNCGGLRFLSKYCFKISCLAMILGIWLGSVQFHTLSQWITTKNLIYLLQSVGLFALYILLSIIFVFSPRFIVYKKIRKEKNKLLNEIYDELKETDLDFKNPQTHKDKVEELTVLYNTIDKFNPLFFDIKYLNIYFSALPLLPQIAGILFPILLEIMIKEST